MSRSPGLQHFVGAGAMGAVAASGTASGAMPLCSYCLGSITSSSSIVLPLKTFARNSFSRNKPLSATKHFAFDFTVEGIPNIFLWDNLQRHSSYFGCKLIYLCLAYQNLRTTVWVTSHTITHMVVISPDYDGALFSV